MAMKRCLYESGIELTAQSACANGHATDERDSFCRICGSPVGGERSAAEPPILQTLESSAGAVGSTPAPRADDAVAVSAEPLHPGTSAGWHRDPTGRHDGRYWD